MTGRDELSTADLASQQPDDAAAHQPPDRGTDPGDADREPLPPDLDSNHAGDATSRDDADEPAHGRHQGAADTTGAAGPLLAAADAEGVRARWTDVQTAFVDSPRQSVEQADALVAEVMQHLAKTFADERSGLERQWDRGDDIATDDLRTAFQRYRSFFERLLAT
jgi:hypothetical protein